MVESVAPCLHLFHRHLVFSGEVAEVVRKNYVVAGHFVVRLPGYLWSETLLLVISSSGYRVICGQRRCCWSFRHQVTGLSVDRDVAGHFVIRLPGYLRTEPLLLVISSSGYRVICEQRCCCWRFRRRVTGLSVDRLILAASDFVLELLDCLWTERNCWRLCRLVTGSSLDRRIQDPRL